MLSEDQSLFTAQSFQELTSSFFSLFALESQNQIILFFQLFLLSYMVIGLAVLINDYLMPCIETLITKYHFSENMAGLLCAFGISIPEMTTNALSCFHSNTEMVSYGFGAIVGSGIFDFTICLGIASVYSAYYHHYAISFNYSVILRDLLIYSATLLYLVVICWDYEITFFEALFLICLYPLYLIYCVIEQIQYTKRSALDIDEGNCDKISLP